MLNNRLKKDHRNRVGHVVTALWPSQFTTIVSQVHYGCKSRTILMLRAEEIAQCFHLSCIKFWKENARHLNLSDNWLQNDCDNTILLEGENSYILFIWANQWGVNKDCKFYKHLWCLAEKVSSPCLFAWIRFRLYYNSML